MDMGMDNIKGSSCLDRMKTDYENEMIIIINELKKALASEYYAFHMYRSAYNLIRGVRRSSVISELKEHAEEELEHADKLEERIRVLGGYTFSDPTEWDIWNYIDIPTINSNDSGCVLEVIKNSEENAVKLYERLIDIASDDPVTQDLIIGILSKEQEHLYDVKYNMIGLT